jgi:hypothetical protein
VRIFDSGKNFNLMASMMCVRAMAVFMRCCCYCCCCCCCCWRSRFLCPKQSGFWAMNKRWCGYLLEGRMGPTGIG